eukprot:1159521-Pelagomonas_calceolata.AAC.9
MLLQNGGVKKVACRLLVPDGEWTRSAAYNHSFCPFCWPPKEPDTPRLERLPRQNDSPQLLLEDDRYWFSKLFF